MYFPAGFVVCARELRVGLIFIVQVAANLAAKAQFS